MSIEKDKRARDGICRIEDELKKRFGEKGEVRFFRAPGRVDWLGSHTDYNQGLILASTVDREIIAGARLRDDRALNLYSLNLDKEFRTSIDDSKPDEKQVWANYPRGVIQELVKSGINLPGMDIAFYGDIPIGANLSSSAAIESVTLEAVLGLLDQPMTRWQKAFVCWRAENYFVGMPCGILDQFTIINSEKDHLLFLDCDRLSSELTPIIFKAKNKSAQTCLLVIDSGVGRELVASEYRKRVSECRTAYKVLKTAGFKIKNLSQLKIDDLKKAEKKLEPVLFRRVRHIVTENERVRKARDAAKRQNFVKLGKLFEEGYLSSSRDYENSITELDMLHDLLAEFPGILGTRIAGAGWGGCLVALAQKPDLKKLDSYLTETYQKQTGRRFRVFPVVTGEAPGELKER